MVDEIKQADTTKIDTAGDAEGTPQTNESDAPIEAEIHVEPPGDVVIRPVPPQMDVTQLVVEVVGKNLFSDPAKVPVTPRGVR